MSEITITPVAEASIGPARHPIYCQYQGQSGPQDAFIALDCRDGSAWADYNAEIGNAVPARFAAALAMHLLGELVAHPSVEFERGMVAPVGASFSRMIAGIKSASATH